MAWHDKSPRIQRRTRYQPLGTGKRPVPAMPWDEKKSVIQAQTSSLVALDRAKARHDVMGYSPEEEPWNQDSLRVDPGDFSDEDIRVALGLPETFDVNSLRQNPALLETLGITDPLDRLYSYGNVKGQQIRLESEKDRRWWQSVGSELMKWAGTPIVDAAQFAGEVISAPITLANMLITEAENYDKAAQELWDLRDWMGALERQDPEGYKEWVASGDIPEGLARPETKEAEAMVKYAPGLKLLEQREASTGLQVKYALGRVFSAMIAPSHMIQGSPSPEDLDEFNARMAKFQWDIKEAQNPFVGKDIGQQAVQDFLGDAATLGTSIAGGVMGAHLDPASMDIREGAEGPFGIFRSGHRVTSRDTFLAAVGMTYYGQEGHEEEDARFDATVKELMAQGAGLPTAQAAAFGGREDLSQAAKMAHTVLADPEFWIGVPPAWKLAKVPGMIGRGVGRGLRQSTTAITSRVDNTRVFRGGLSTEKEALHLLNVNRSGLGTLINRIPGTERLFGVASQIPRWETGDIRRAVMENIGLNGRWKTEAASKVAETMAILRSKVGDFQLVGAGELRRQLLRPWHKELRKGLEIVNDITSPDHLKFAPGRVWRRKGKAPTPEQIRERAFEMVKPFREKGWKLIGRKSKYKMAFVGETQPELGWGDRGWLEKYRIQSAKGDETWEVTVDMTDRDLIRGSRIGPPSPEDLAYIESADLTVMRMDKFGAFSRKELVSGFPPDVMRDMLALLSRSKRLKARGIKKLKGQRVTREYVQAREKAGIETERVAEYGVEQSKRRVWAAQHEGEWGLDEAERLAKRAAPGYEPSYARFGTPAQFKKLEELAKKQLQREADDVAYQARHTPESHGYWRDVFERPSEFAGLTNAERSLIKDIQDWYRDMRRMLVAEGVPLNVLGELGDAFDFVSAKVKGFRLDVSQGGPKTGKNAQKDYLTIAEARPTTGEVARSRAGFTKSRAHADMRESVEKAGTDYYSPFETIEQYMTSAFNLIIEARSQRKMQGYLRGTSVKARYPELVAAKEYAKKADRRQTLLMNLVNQFSRQLLPHKSQIDSLKRWFPGLEADIDRAMSFTGDQWRLAMDNMRGMQLPPGSLKDDAFQAIKEIGFEGGLPKYIDRKTINKALKAVELGKREHDAMVRVVMNMIKREQGVQRKVEMDSLIRKMAAARPETEAKLLELQAAVGSRKDQLGTALAGEVESKVFKGQIWTGERAEWAWSKTEAFMAPATRWYDRTVIPLNSLIRSMKTVADFGAPIIQGLPLLFMHPEKWAFATTMHFRAFGDDMVKARYLLDNADDVSSFIKYGMHLGSTEMTEAAREGGTFARINFRVKEATEKTPLLGRNNALTNKLRAGLQTPTNIIEVAGRRFSSSFEGFLDIARIEIMKGLKETAMRSSNPQRAMVELAEYANKMTGVTSTLAIGVPTGQRALENAALFFSPRYTRAMASLIADMTRGGLKGELARSSLAHLLMGQIATHVATSAMLGQEINLIPGSPGFLKNRVGGDAESAGMYIGSGGKFISILNLLGDVVTTGIETKGDAFLHWNVFSSKTYDQNPTLKRMRYMMAPGVQEAWSWVSGSDPIGRQLPDPTDVEEILPYFASKASPFAVEAAIEMGITNSGPTSFFAESLGGMTSPVSAFIKRNDLRNQYIMEDYGPDGKIEQLGLESYEELKSHFRHRSILASIEQRHPDLVDWTNKAEAQAKDFVRNDERVLVSERLATIRAEAINGVYSPQNAMIEKGYNQIGEILAREASPRAGREFQEAFWKINNAEQARVRELEAAHASFFKDRDVYFENTDPANLSSAAAEDFMEFYLSPKARDKYGRLNHPAIDRKIEDIERGIKIWYMKHDGLSEEDAAIEAKKVTAESEEQYLTRLQATPAGMSLHPKVVRFIQGFPLVDKYHNAYKTALPEDDHSKYEVFIAARWAVKQEMLATPEYQYMEWLVGMEQDKLRMEDYDLDDHMEVYYDMAPKHPRNIREQLEKIAAANRERYK
jgi:hypothetical protein